MFVFFIWHDCISWTPSHFSKNFLSKLRQGHRVVLNQTKLWVTDGWSPGLSISRWQCVHICTRAKEYVPRLCALLWTQKTRMFLFVSSDPLCFEVEVQEKTRTFHKSFQAPSLSLISQITEKKIKRGKHKDNHVMTHIHLVILISQGTLRNVITTHIHVVGCPSIYIFILQMSDIIPVLINIITTF